VFELIMRLNAKYENRAEDGHHARSTVSRQDVALDDWLTAIGLADFWLGHLGQLISLVIILDALRNSPYGSYCSKLLAGRGSSRL
jgi:hypothetical protein